MTILQQLAAAQNSAEIPINENFETLEAFAMYGKKHSTTAGLTWGYYGGRWGGALIADGTVSLGASTTTYLVVERATGTLSAATSTTNWNNTTTYARVYKITTGPATVTAVEDHRAGPNGAGGAGGAGGSATWGAISGTLSTQTDLQTALDAKAQDRRTVSAITPASGVANINVGLGDYFTLAPTANVTSITFSNLPGSGKGASVFVLFTQDSTPRTVAWPASFKWEGSAPSVSTGSGALDLLALSTLDNGTTWHATLSKGRA